MGEIVRGVGVGCKSARLGAIPADLMLRFGYGRFVGVVGVVGVVIVLFGVNAFLVVVENNNFIDAENGKGPRDTSGKE